MSLPDALVIGGGISGLLTARALAQGGMCVTIIERQGVGQESSWAGGGILSPLYPWRYPESVTALARWSQGRYPSIVDELRADTGIDPQWTQNGLLILDDQEHAAALAWAANHHSAMERLTAPAIHALEPGLAHAPPHGLWLPQVAQVRNPRLVQALRADLTTRGVQFFEDCPVRRVTLEGGRVIGVETDKGPFAAPRVAVTAGAWSATLLDGVGPALGVAPVKGQMVLIHATPGLVQRIVLAAGRYVIPRRDGRVLIGSTLEHTGFEKTTTPDARASLLDFAARWLPGLVAHPVERQWAGLRPGTAEGVPYIGPHPTIEGLYVNAGHYRNGVVLGPASAHVLAQQMLGASPDLDPAPYAWHARPGV